MHIAEMIQLELVFACENEDSPGLCFARSLLFSKYLFEISRASEMQFKFFKLAAQTRFGSRVSSLALGQFIRVQRCPALSLLHPLWTFRRGPQGKLVLLTPKNPSPSPKRLVGNKSQSDHRRVSGSWNPKRK